MATPDTISELALWLKADAIAGLSDGEAVSTWPDSSSDARDVSQGTSGYKPLYKTGIINGKPAVLFDGTDDVLFSSDYLYSDNTKSGVTVIAVIASTQMTGDRDFIFDFGSLGDRGYGLAFDNATPSMYSAINYGGADTIGTSGTGSGSFHILTGKITFGSEQRLYLDGSSVASSAITLTELGATEVAESATRSISAGPVCVGGQSKTSSETDRFLRGYLAELIVYRQALSDTDRATVEDYLTGKYFNLTPETTNLAITGSVPAIALSPASDSLTLAGGTPQAVTAIPVSPSSGSLTLTTGTPLVFIPIQPATDQMLITGGVPVPSVYVAGYGDADFFELTGEASTGEQLGRGAGSFSLMEAEGTTGAIGSSSLSQVTGEAEGLKGHAGAGLGSFFTLTSQGTTGAENDGTFFTLSGSGEIVLAHIAKGDRTFLGLTGEAAGELHAYLYGSGRFGQIYGEATTTKGHLASGFGSFSLLTGASEGIKGHAADGDADLFLMTAEGVCFQRANLAGDADLYALEGDGAVSFSLYASDEYILYHRRPS